MKKTLLIIAALFMMASCDCGTNNAGKTNETKETNENKTFAELGTDSVRNGEIYLVTPEGAVTSTGTQWLGAFKKGSENKLVIYFYGGGLSVNEYSAARGFSKHADECFYFDDMELWKNIAYSCFKAGFGSDLDSNPFKDWSVIILPYTTGDLHIGTGEFEYTDLEGNQKILYHHGYTNFKLYMDRVMPYLGTPEAIVVTGSSAGGFGTSFLAEDITEIFPDTKNFVSCVDASLLYWDQFPEVCKNVWKAPEHIANRFVSDNPVMDCLTTLHNDKPYVKILFTCSLRDDALVSGNNFFEKGAKTPGTKEEGEIFQQRLFTFVKDLIAVDNNAGIFIWDDMISNEETKLTVHTIETGENFLTDRGGNGSVAKWINDAVNGNVRVVGLECFNK